MCVRCAMFMHKGTLFLRPARSLMGTCRQKEVSIPTKTYMQSEIFPPKNIFRLMDGYRQTAVWSLENIYRLMVWRVKVTIAGKRSVYRAIQSTQDFWLQLHAITALWWVIPLVCHVLPFRSAINTDKVKSPARCQLCEGRLGGFTGQNRCG